MAKDVNEKDAITVEQLNKRLNMLDQRLDNIDSVVTAMVERIMSRPINLTLTCPNCGKHIEINIIGSGKPGA